MRTEFWWDNLRETDRLEDLCEDGRRVLKGIFKKSVTVLNYVDWPRTGAGDGLLWTWR